MGKVTAGSVVIPSTLKKETSCNITGIPHEIPIKSGHFSGYIHEEIPLTQLADRNDLNNWGLVIKANIQSSRIQQPKTICNLLAGRSIIFNQQSYEANF